MPMLEAFDSNGKLLATGNDITEEEASVIIPNLTPRTTYKEGSFYVRWNGVNYVSDKVVVPEFTTLESTYKEIVFYFKEAMTVNPKTAYDIAVKNGFTGTEKEWVDSIKGDKGEKGDIGATGLQGVKGDSGEGKVTDKSVTYKKTDFLTIGKNIFNSYNLLDSKLLNYSNGNISDGSYYVTSDFLPVLPNTSYTQSHSDVITFWNENKQFISGIQRGSTPNQPRTFTTPSNSQFIRTSTIKEGIDKYSYKNYQIELGDTATPFESFRYYLNGFNVVIPVNAVSNDNIVDNQIGIEKLGFTSNSDNLFNPDKITRGYYVNNTTGSLTANASYSASDYILLGSGVAFTKNNTFSTYAFYNSNRDFISSTTTATNTIQKPDGAKYVRISMLTSAVNSTMLVSGTEVPTQFIPYKRVIPQKYLDLPTSTTTKQDIVDHYGKFNLKAYTADFSKQLNPDVEEKAEIAFIGDSWVQGGVVRSGERLTLPLREKYLKLGYEDGGIGFVSFANNHIGNGLISVTLNGTWTQYDESLGNIDKSKGLDSAMAESSTSGDSIKVAFSEELDYYEIHTLNTGTWKYNVDGGQWVTVDATTQEVTPVNMSLGKHTINIEVVSGTVTFIGSYAYKGKRGVVIHKIGNGGLKASHITSTDRDNWVKQAKRIKANTFGILLGTNDMAQNVSLIDYEKDMREIISRILEAKPLASIFLIAPSGNKYDNSQTFTIQDYSDIQLKIAKDLNVGHVSLVRALGDYNTTNSNGLMYTDGVHPNKSGGYAISNVVYDRLLRI